MRMNSKLLLAFGVGFVATAGATLAQSYGRGRNVAFVDGTAISPSSVTTSGAVTAGSVVSNGNVSVPATSRVCLNGPTCTSYLTQVADTGIEFRRLGTLVYSVTGANQVATAQSFRTPEVIATTASGLNAYTCSNVGCRFSLGNAARYLYDDGTSLEFVAPVEMTSLATTATGSGTKAMQIESGTVICLDGSACTRSLRGDGAESSLGSVRLYGSAIFQGFIDAVASLRLRNIGITIADSGGAGAAAYTQSTYPSAVKYTCNDADGCDITMSEVGIIDGLTMRFTNESANTVNFTDTAGVTELAGNFAMGQWDTLVLQYNTDRWVEVSRSNN